MNRGKVALFIGADITAHLVLNKIVPEFKNAGYTPVVYLPKHKASPKANQPELREAAFYERHLTNNVVYPFLEKNPAKNPDFLSPSALAEKEKVHLEYIDNVNDVNFVTRLKNDAAYVGALSVRCFQIFKPEIINVFKEREFFLNSHPGVLPTYKGVLSTVRAMASAEREYGWTLHEVDEGIDTGDILWVKAKKMDLSKTGLMANIDMAMIGADSIKRAIDELKEGNVLKGYPQDSSKGAYYSYPTREELNEWNSIGLRLADAEETRNVLVEKFSNATTPHGKKLSAEIEKAIDCWKLEQSEQAPCFASMFSPPMNTLPPPRKRPSTSNQIVPA
ncbi:MAG: hypothetical protein DI626_07075 [Micavibrio aeruginosavorus]|uniref:Formyl transferase N-terminal domain-containing protein n=1 Tax=Micavibrio aeruginosavorus TaxID=349221 RepID=A0A2W5BRH7_9BACT|nr:MAG: hypothetical protein DI626_07075 [Micavibrio aeruginosavorus]